MSKFARTIALLSVVAAFYVGHGLHSHQNVAMPSLATPAYAGGASALQAQYNKSVTIYTATEDGRGLYVWSHTAGTGKPPEFVGLYHATAKK